jgi:thioredoxin-like negative regulator of GroEL
VEIVDVTEKPDVAAQYGVWSLPTTIVLDAQRKVIAINQGVAHEYKLREQIMRADRTAKMINRRGEKEWQLS